MFIERINIKNNFIKAVLGLKKQVLIVQGARQVGKTSFIKDILDSELKELPKVYFNLLYTRSIQQAGQTYYGCDFLGASPRGEDFLKNLRSLVGDFESFEKPLLLFFDEVDRYPPIMEFVQTLAEYPQLKCILTGSNLENIAVENAATGRKKYFDLYPISFEDFLKASEQEPLWRYYQEVSFEKNSHSDFFHHQLEDFFEVYLRIGGLPRILATYLETYKSQPQNLSEISELMKDLAVTIEENVKTILGDKIKLYEYEDILRKLTYLSMNTLKLTHLQVQHASRSEAMKIIVKTVGARVIHKIRLWEIERDLSKYILFDPGMAHYLMEGSDLLQTKIPEKNRSILYETAVGNELIRQLISREDLFYWKSGNKGEVEFLIRSPVLFGIDVKSTKGSPRSLYSLALSEKDVQGLVKIQQGPASLEKNHPVQLPNDKGRRRLPLMIIPHYLTGRVMELSRESFK